MVRPTKQRQILAGALALAAAVAAQSAQACTYDVPQAIAVHYSGVKPGSAQERRLDQQNLRRHYRNLRADALAGKSGSAEEMPWNVVNALVPPVAAGAKVRVGCGAVRIDEDAAGYLSEEALAADFSARTGMVPDNQYSSDWQFYLRRFAEVASSCNAEFRRSLAADVALQARPGDLAAVWTELYAHDLRAFGHIGSYLPSRRLLRFSQGRTAPLVPDWAGVPSGGEGREKALTPIRAEHYRAALTFLSADPAARRIVAVLDQSIAAVQARPGGDERFCPAAIAERDRIVDKARTEKRL